MVKISQEGQTVWEGVVPFVTTYGEVKVAEALLYINDYDNVSLAIRQGNFAQTKSIGAGWEWQIEIGKP